MTDNKKRIYNAGPRGKGHPMEDYTTLGSPYKDLTIVKSEQMAEVLDKLDKIEKNLDLLLRLLRSHVIKQDKTPLGGNSKDLFSPDELYNPPPKTGWD